MMDLEQILRCTKGVGGIPVASAEDSERRSLRMAVSEGSTQTSHGVSAAGTLEGSAQAD